MAINVNIPGIGNVEVQGAAEESTVRELVRVMQASVNQRRRFDTDLNQSFRQIDRSADEASSSMNNMAVNARMASSSSSSLYNELQNQLSKSNSAVGDLGSYAMTFGRDLVSTSTLITREWSRNFNATSMASPIKIAAGTINAGLTLAGDAGTLLSNALGRATSFLGPLSDVAAAAGADVSKLGAGILKEINDLLSKELELSIKTMHDFAMMGGNFAGSIDEIRMVARDSHLNLEQFSTAVKANREQLNSLGLNMRSATAGFSQFLGYMDTGVSDYQQTSGINRTYRNELRALGFEVEEQANVMASYLSVLRSTKSQQEFNNLSARQVAEGTREYAGNLKILAEFTGKDAKALMERARAESMRGALLAKLDANQQQAFIDSSAALNTFPEDVRGNIQNALMQQLSGGTITDPVIAANSRAMAFVQDLAEKIKMGGTNMVDYTAQQSGVLRDQIIAYQKATGGVESLNALFGAGGLVQNLGKFNDSIGAMKPIDPEAVRQSRQAMTDMANANSQIVKGYLDAQQAAQNFANFLSSLGTQLLPTYAGVIGDTTRMTADLIKIVIKALSGSDITRDVGNLDATFNRAIERLENNLKNIPQRADGDIVGDGGAELSWVGEKGREAIIPLKNGKTIPVEFSGKSNNIDANGLIMAAKQMQSQLKLSSDNDKIPESVAMALESAFTKPDGFVSIMKQFKDQMTTDNKNQMDIMQQQIDKMNLLITAMQDNTRTSEKIAYSMA